MQPLMVAGDEIEILLGHAIAAAQLDAEEGADDLIDVVRQDDTLAAPPAIATEFAANSARTPSFKPERAIS